MNGLSNVDDSFENKDISEEKRMIFDKNWTDSASFFLFENLEVIIFSEFNLTIRCDKAWL